MTYTSNDLDVIIKEISDHQPIIHHGAFFWNIMMQGNKRFKGGYNNAFGLIEDECAYISRLMKIAKVIAKLVRINPEIEFITLCEGPINPEHVKIFFLALKRYPDMEPFTKGGDFYKPKLGEQNWGLLMLTNFHYCVDSLNEVPKLNCKLNEIDSRLVNRFQLWKLTNSHGEHKYVGLAHFPFAGDECITSKNNLSETGQKYCEFVSGLIEDFSDEKFFFCADFNFNPFLIGSFQEHKLNQIPTNNSVLLSEAHSQKSVTVDGILLSKRNKQIYQGTVIEPILHHFRLFNNKKLAGKPYTQEDEQEVSVGLSHACQGSLSTLH